MKEAADLWRPLRTPIFRQLLIADVVSDVGTFMQGVGSAWLMVSIGAGPLLVALTQTASTLPFFLFALPAGAIGDIADRRKLILITETWMVCVAVALIAVAGVGAAFMVNVVSFLGVIVVVARWKRPVRARATPPETLRGATVAAIRYVRNVPAIRTLMLRAGAVMFCASAPFALLPAIAHAVSGSAIGYGALLGCFGAGAVGGALVMQWARSRWPTEVVVSTAVVVLGVTILGLAVVRNLPVLMAVMLVSGGAWITFIALANALVQTMAPDWVRARVLAIFMLVTQGGLAAGSAAWGAAASRAGIGTALVWAGVATIATTALGLLARLPDGAGDVSPWNHWRMPAIVRDLEMRGARWTNGAGFGVA